MCRVQPTTGLKKRGERSRAGQRELPRAQSSKDAPTHVLGGLQVDDDELPSSLLRDQREVAAGFDLQRGPQRDREVGFPAGRRKNKTSRAEKINN